MKKYSKTKLAERTGYSREHITRVMNGKVMPSVPCLRGIAKFFGVSMEHVLEHIERGGKPIEQKKGRTKTTAAMKQYFNFIGARPRPSNSAEVDMINVLLEHGKLFAAEERILRARRDRLRELSKGEVG